MTIVVTYIGRDCARNRRRERRAKDYEARRTVTGCRDRILKAVSSPSLRTKPETTGSSCLPEVAIYAAGYRKSNVITAR